MGEVWRARDLDLDRLVALKFLFFETAARGSVERLTREARSASALNHHNIVTVHEVIRHRDTPVIVMEFVEGTALRGECGQPLPVRRVVGLGLQIAEALAVAHESGTVHCDIKPENILVRPDGYVKILDFGLAHNASKDSIQVTKDTIGGTLRYMSPEQARGLAFTPASDIFSFGLVLYELAAGRHAFPAALPFETLRGILKADPDPTSRSNPLVPSALDALILSMLSKEETARPNARQIAASLQQLEQQMARVRRSSIRRIALTGTACALMAALGWLFWKRPWDREDNWPLQQVTWLVPENRATAAAISPDGSRIAYANADGIFLRLQDGTIRALPSPANVIVENLSWFADGTKMVASGFSILTFAPSIWIVSTRSAPAYLLVDGGREGVPSPDGGSVAFVSANRSEIDLIDAGGVRRRVLFSKEGDTFPGLAWLDKRYLIYQRRRFSGATRTQNSLDRYYDRSFESVDVESGKVADRIPNLWVNSPAALTNHRILFLRYDPPGSDISDGLWEVGADPQTGRFLGAPSHLTTISGGMLHVHTMSAASDGKRLAFLRQSLQLSVFVAEFQPEPPAIVNVRRLTLDERENYPHAWTADSRAVIFESDRNGSWDIFKQDIEQRVPQTLVATPLGEVLPQLSPDGRWVLYRAFDQKNNKAAYQLMRVPVDGGTPVAIPVGRPWDEFVCALERNKRCVVRVSEEGKYQTFYELDPFRGAGRELARIKWKPGIVADWGLSPDGSRIAIPNHSSSDARILVVELNPNPRLVVQHEVTLPGLTDLSGLNWSADGAGWFTKIDTNTGGQMFYVYLNGKFRALPGLHGWAVPAPDGRHVAVMDNITATNVWLSERK